MKKLIILGLALAIAMLTSCEKNNLEPQPTTMGIMLEAEVEQLSPGDNPQTK